MGYYRPFSAFSGFSTGRGVPGDPILRGERGPDPKKGLFGVPKPAPRGGFTSTPRERGPDLGSGGLPDPGGPGGASQRSPRGLPGPLGGVSRAPGSRRGPAASPARGVLHQPLAPGPRGSPERSPGIPVPGGPRQGPRGVQIPTPSQGVGNPAPAGYPRKSPFSDRGAPARGVDVKPPLPGPQKGLRDPKIPKNTPKWGIIGLFRPFRGFLRGEGPRETPF